MSLVDSTTGEVVTRSFADNEATIERGLGTFVEVGEALMAIRDGRQYRELYSDFDTYCRERWGMDKRYANRTIEAAGIVGKVGPIGPTPQTESQARALSPLRDDPAAMAEVMDEVTTEAAEQSARVTAERIAEKVNEVIELRDEAHRSADEFAAMHPEGFDPKLDKELIRQRGELTRLCRDLVAVGNQAEFIERHADFIRDSHRDAVRDAVDWLTEFHNQLEAS